MKNMKDKTFLLCGIPTIAAILSFGATNVSGTYVDLYNFEGNLRDTSGFDGPLNMNNTVNGTPTTFVNETAPQINPLYGTQSLRIGSGKSYTWLNPLANTKLELQQFTVEAWIKPSTA